MINKDEAVAAAEEIVALERERLAEIQDARAPRVPVWLRVSSLSSLEPRHQTTILREAEKTVQGKGSFRVWAVAWVATIGLVWYFLNSGQHSLGSLWALAPALGVFGIRGWFVRRELSRLISAGKSGRVTHSE